jgi:hypothetical protein
MPFYERGDVRIHYQEAGSGFPLLVIPGGGLNSTIAGLASQTHPFNPFGEFKDEFRPVNSRSPSLTSHCAGLVNVPVITTLKATPSIKGGSSCSTALPATGCNIRRAGCW